MPSRAKLFQDLETMMGKEKKNSSHFALFFMNLDNFQKVNSGFGDAASNNVLRSIARRLLSVSSMASIYHIGADEFVFIVKKYKDKEALSEIAKKILSLVKKEIDMGSKSIYITSSIGISIYPENSEDKESLVRMGHNAMLEVKKQGKNDFRFIGIEEAVDSKALAIESKIYQKIQENKIELVYQPQVNAVSNKIVGVEILIRWEDIEISYATSMEMIGIAEDTGMVSVLDAYVLKKAMFQIKALNEKFKDVPRISINLSAATVERRDFVDRFMILLKETGCNPKWITLELIESYLVYSFDEIAQKLDKLHKLGVRLALDDFGKGYSSLTYIKQLPIDTVKIDKHFIDGLGKNKEDETIVKAIVGIAKNLGYKLVAEGVETKEQKELLLSYGCEVIQGFYFYKTLSLESLEALLKKQQTL